MRIYTAPGVNAYTINANKLNTNINLPLGSYSTVFQAWDNCGGVGKTTVNIKVSKINLPPPRFLYATEYKAGRIAEYVVNPSTGSINPTSQGSTWGHWGPVDIASDPGGYRLYVVNEGSHDLDAYFIDRSTGNLTQVPGSPFALTGIGGRVVVHPSGHFVYATSTSSGSNTAISAFAVQSDGSLTPVPGSPFSEGSGSFGAIAMDRIGKYLYVSAGATGGAGAVAGYSIDQYSGALTPVPGSPFLTPAYPGCAQYCSLQPADLGVDPIGNYLYGAQSAQDAIVGFKIDRATGSLTDVPGSPYAEGYYNVPNNSSPRDPWRLSIDPSGKFIYVADEAGNDFTIFKLNETTGVPTYEASIPNQPNAVLPGLCAPTTVAVDPSGSFVYSQGTVSSSGCSGPLQGHAMIGYSINQGNGYLLSVPGSPFPNPNLYTSTSSSEKVLVTR
jgi:6-phosphogluconolactonase (cycloisomerase 2 family)